MLGEPAITVGLKSSAVWRWLLLYTIPAHHHHPFTPPPPCVVGGGYPAYHIDTPPHIPLTSCPPLYLLPLTLEGKANVYPTTQGLSTLHSTQISLKGSVASSEGDVWCVETHSLRGIMKEFCGVSHLISGGALSCVYLSSGTRTPSASSPLLCTPSEGSKGWPQDGLCIPQVEIAMGLVRGRERIWYVLCVCAVWHCLCAGYMRV